MPELHLDNELLSTLQATKRSLALLVWGCNRHASKFVRQAIYGILGSHIHPNILWLDADSESVNVESIRAVGIFLCGTAYYSSLPKLAVIENADRLNIQSLNSLLKPLEDLTGNTHVILTARHSKSLPSTILSRCIHIRMKPVSDEVLIEDEALEIYKALLALLDTEKHPSLKLYAFIDKNFSSSEQLVTFRGLINHLISKAIKFKAEVPMVLLDDEQQVLHALTQRLSLDSLLDILASTEATLIGAEKFGLDPKSVVLVILAKLIT